MMSITADWDGQDRESGGAVAGVTSGIVSQNGDPDGLGRVKLKLPWREESFETDWVRVVSLMAGADRGAFFLPEVGDEVLVAFDRDDIRFPYVLGSLWSRSDKPPETNQDGRNDIRVIRSRSGHVLIFDDGDKGRILIRLSDGKSITIDENGIVIDDEANRIRLDSAAGAVAIEAKQTLTLKAPHVSIEAASSVQINGKRMSDA